MSTPPPSSPPEIVADVTPRTAAAMQRVPKPKRQRLLREDNELELPDEDFAAPGEDSVTLQQRQVVPKLSRAAEEEFIHTRKIDGEEMIVAGPYGLAPELSDLFTFPLNVLRRHREEDVEAPSSKRARHQTDEDVEAGRRDMSAFQPDDFYSGDQTFDTIAPADDMFQPDFDAPGLSTPRAQREASFAPSRAESIARAIQFGDATDHPLAMFDPRRSDSASQLDTPSKQSAAGSDERHGYSKNTGMAMGLLRKELEEIEGETKTEERTTSFKKTAEGASKKAASAFFFELLVLGTRDCVRMEQTRAFEDITIRSKPRLFQELTA